MISFFPKQIASKAIIIYIGALTAVSVFFLSHAMSLTYIIMGIIWVTGFFALGGYCSRKWKDLPKKRFLTNVALTAAGLRLAWVIFSYFFYIHHTGMPFEFDAADSIAYWEDGTWLSQKSLSEIIDYLFISRDTISDSGYVFYLSLLYKITGPNIFITRVFKVLWSTLTILLAYNFAKRCIGEECARLAAVLFCFMPNLIIYCGLHLKENEMLFLMVLFLERADYLLRSRKYTFWSILIPVLLLLSLFTFRTVLGIAGALAFATGVVFTSTSVIGRQKRVMLIVWAVVAAFSVAGGTIVNEVEGLWEERNTNQEAKRSYQTAKGNQWAKYATGTAMAPMMFVLPFPTMVDVDEQYNQQILSGGNYVRNFLGSFVILAVFTAIFVKKNWRDLSFLGSFVIAYLGIISASGFANSERFLLPGLPGLLIMAAYGMTLLNAKNFRFIKVWYWVVPIMAVAWAYFKLGSRGLF